MHHKRCLLICGLLGARWLKKTNFGRLDTELTVGRHRDDKPVYLAFCDFYEIIV